MPDARAIEDAAAMFKALADPARLRLLVTLAEAPRHVGELARIEDERIGTVSARLKVLRQARLVTRRREGKLAVYGLADAHVLALVTNTIDHACERDHPQT